MYMSLPLNFYFTTKDPQFSSTTAVVSSEPGKYISHAFVKTPIYDFTDAVIGYKVSDDYVQQVDVNKYIVRLNNTYYLEGKGTISWQYVFENDTNNIYYPINKLAASNIISATGDYYGKNGFVSLFPKPDGTRVVNITFV